MHLDAVVAEAQARGGAGGIAITHGHIDHVEGLDALGERLGGPPVAVAGRLGPLTAVRTPGHSTDSMTWIWGSVACTGDAVLGEGSVFVSAQLGEYLEALEGLRTRGLTLLLPGHGDPVTEPARRIGALIEHTGASASAAWSPRSTAARARSTSCSTTRGATRPRRCGRRPRCRSPRTSTSWRPRTGCRRASSARSYPPGPPVA